MSECGTYAPARASRSDTPELHPGMPLHCSQRPTPTTSVHESLCRERKADNVELLGCNVVKMVAVGAHAVLLSTVLDAKQR